MVAWWFFDGFPMDFGGFGREKGRFLVLFPGELKKWVLKQRLRDCILREMKRQLLGS